MGIMGFFFCLDIRIDWVHETVAHSKECRIQLVTVLYKGALTNHLKRSTFDIFKCSKYIYHLFLIVCIRKCFQSPLSNILHKKNNKKDAEKKANKWSAQEQKN